MKDCQTGRGAPKHASTRVLRSHIGSLSQFAGALAKAPRTKAGSKAVASSASFSWPNGCSQTAVLVAAWAVRDVATPSSSYVAPLRREGPPCLKRGDQAGKGNLVDSGRRPRVAAFRRVLVSPLAVVAGVARVAARKDAGRFFGTVLGARYADPVAPSEERAQPFDVLDDAPVRDPLAVPEAVLDARRRPMSERLELALNWNTVASELRAGLAAVTGRSEPNS